MSVPYRFQSKNTLFFVVSSNEDRPGQEVDTRPGKDSIPPHSILIINPPIREPITVARIKGASGLFVALIGDAEKTKLTWSAEPYEWIIRANGPGSSVITPRSGQDLYWVDEFGVGIGDHVEVRSGRNIQPPQNEWYITPLLRPSEE